MAKGLFNFNIYPRVFQINASPDLRSLGGALLAIDNHRSLVIMHKHTPPYSSAGGGPRLSGEQVCRLSFVSHSFSSNLYASYCQTACTPAFTCTHAPLSHMHTHAQIHKHTNTHTHSLSHTHTHTRNHTNTQTHKTTRTHTHTNTHTNT